MSEEIVLMNRLHNCKNYNQGETKKVLCVCSAGLLRSPTAAVVLSQEPFNFNTRAAGMEKRYALIPVDDVLIAWADEIVCMEEEHAELLRKKTDKPVINLNIQDSYRYRDEKLVWLIKEKYAEAINLLVAGKRAVAHEIDEKRVDF